jgi:PAS domain S-box-containing protein
MALASVLEPGNSVLSLLSRLAWAETAHPDGYLADLTEQLVRLLGVDVALVGVIDNTRKSYRTIANYSALRGKLGTFEQELLGSAAAEVALGRGFLVSVGAELRFPLDWVVREHRAVGFFGVALLGASGDRIGVLSLYHSSELKLDDCVVARLETIAQRAAAEMCLSRGARHASVNSFVVEAGRIHRGEENAERSEPPPSGRLSIDESEEPSATSTKATLDELRYRHYFELGAMGMAFVSLNGELLDVNECLCEMLKRSRRRLIGARWTDYCLPEELALERRLLIEIAEGKSDGFTSDTRFHLPDGTTLSVGLAVRCVRRLDGRVDYLTLLVQDLTPRRLIEAQLMHSQRLEAVGRLAGGIAHDFNNLLTAILAHTEFTKQSSDPAVIEMIDGVRAAAIRAANLTSQLLAFARRQVIEPKVLDLNRLVSNTTEMLGRIVGEDIEVVIGTTADLWKVRVDPGQVEQVLVNLAVNARDAMPNGGRLLLGTENLPRDRVAQTLGADASLLDYVVIVVADTGTGMSEETMSHLFEPFYTTKEEGKGSGLGLATCHGIVSQNGGQIRVHSAPKLGTTFRIYWPRYHSDTATAPSVPPLATAFANKETILLVEDDDMVRRVAVRVLRNKGFSVISAASGIEAIEVATRHVGPIDLLLTDLVMPKMSGDKLAKELGPRRPEMRILFTSGYAEAAHDHGLGPGANFLQKPYLPQQLVERIRKVLDR